MPGHIQAIERAAAVLRLLSTATQDLGLQEISDALGLPKTTAHGIVKTLRHLSLVEQDRDSRRYRLGRGLEELGGGGLDPHLLRSHSINWADSLAANTGASVLVGVPRADDVEVVHHVFRPDGSSQRMRIGETLPLHATALGKVLLAFGTGLGPRMRSLRLDRYTTRTVQRLSQLEEEVATARRRGYASTLGEHIPDVASIAAPIRAYGGLGVGAVALVGPADQICTPSGAPRKALIDRVVSAAKSISEQLELDP
ncbi:MAG: IclR family transcriptional regulator [Nocardioidaceae bacterium]